MSRGHRSSGSFSELMDDDSRSSTDGRRSSDHGSPSRQLNGHSVTNGADPSDENMDPVERLERELQRTREEKEALAAQHRTLLGKLTQMRTSLGNKLQQDAVRFFWLHVWIVLSKCIDRKSSTGENN